MVSNIQLINESFERRYLQEAKWKCQLKSGVNLRKAIDNGDAEAVREALIDCWKEINSLMPDDFTDDELESKVEELQWLDTDDEEEFEENIDYELNDFYDFCDAFKVWIPLNESFERRYLKEAEISPENKEDNAVLLRNIKEYLSRLNEAEMSDEDKKDSAILWDIYNKTQKRANAKLTPEEKSVLAKYGLTRDKNKNIGITDDDILPGYPLVSRRIGHNAVLNGSDKINLADRARKINNRGIGYENDVALSSRHRLGNGFRFSHPEIDNHREYRDEKTGEWKKIKDKGLLDRERRSQIVNMSSDVEDMKHALKQRNSAKSQLDNNDTKFDAKRDAIQKAYERELAWNEKRRQEASNWAKDDLDTSNDEINSILNRKKKNESIKSRKRSKKLKENYMFGLDDSVKEYIKYVTPEDYQINQIPSTLTFADVLSNMQSKRENLLGKYVDSALSQKVLNKLEEIIGSDLFDETYNNWLHSDVRKSRKVFKNESLKSRKR